MHAEHENMIADQLKKGETRMDDLAAQLAGVKLKLAEFESTQQSMQKTMATNSELICKIHASTAELVDVFNSWKGAMKTLEWIGRIAKPVSAIAIMIGAVWGTVTAIKSGVHIK